jgi:membrane protease YdiL (CAAX protease family)
MLQRYWDGEAWTDRLAAPAATAPPPPPFPTLPFPVAVGALLSMAVPLVASRWILQPFADHDWPIVAYVLVAGVVAYGPPVAFWWFASRRWGHGRPTLDVGLMMRRVDLGWGPLTWLACFLGQALMAIIIVVFDIPFQSNTESVRALRDDRGFVIAMLVLSVVAAPLVEEIVFRGMVLRGFLSRWPVAVAVGAQGVLFGLAHLSPERGMRNIGLVLILSTVGVVLGGSAYLVRRLAPTIIAHALINGIAMAVLLSGWSPATDDAAVVDQAHVVEPHRSDGHGVVVDGLHGLQRRGVDELEMLEAGQRLGLDDRATDNAQPTGVALTSGEGVAHRVQ